MVFIISYEEDDTDQAALVVFRRDENDILTALNAFKDDDAVMIYKKLTEKHPQTDILVSMVEEEMEKTALNKKSTSSIRSGRYPWKSKEKNK